MRHASRNAPFRPTRSAPLHRANDRRSPPDPSNRGFHGDDAQARELPLSGEDTNPEDAATTREARTFADLGLTRPVLDALAAEGYTTPTPIQARAVPHVLAGRDLFGCAQTGTGKTAAFALPLIERLLAAPRPRKPGRCRVLVLAPTRELAGQIHDSFRAYGRNARLRTAAVYGGVSQRPQEEALRDGVDVLVATPGRLLDLVHQGVADLASADFLVLDEADRMLDMGFIHDVRRIVALLPQERQTLLFSATLPTAVRDLAAKLLRRPLEVRTAPQATPAETVDQSVFFVPQQQKRHLLVHLLTTAAMPRTIVFTRTKHGADKLKRVLEKAGIRTAAIHGDKSQNHRERALAAFKSQQPPVLVATDVAARGIDVDHVSHVVNFDLPHEPETYVHRIGRTGRAGMTGAAVSLCDREERPRLQAIERLLGRTIPVREDSPVLPSVEEPAEPRPPRRSAGRGGESRGRRRTDAVRKPADGTTERSRTTAAAPAAKASLRRGRNRYRRAL